MKPEAKLEELFLELKDVSELMIDLAYSALIFNSREIAEEVRRLEAHVDELRTRFELLALAERPERSEELLSLLRISEANERIADAALQLVETVLRGLEPHPILYEVVEEAEETIVRVKVYKQSILVGKTLEELDLPTKFGQRIIAIRRKGRWVYCPRKDEVIRADDVLIARGYVAGREKLEELASGRLRVL